MEEKLEEKLEEADESRSLKVTSLQAAAFVPTARIYSWPSVKERRLGGDLILTDVLDVLTLVAVMEPLCRTSARPARGDVGLSRTIYRHWKTLDRPLEAPQSHPDLHLLESHFLSPTSWN